MKATAAVFRSVGLPLEVAQVEIGEPGPGDVLVDVAASGVCHTDQSIFTGAMPFPTPLVLGHEGAGVVVGIGPDVATITEGDHVVLSYIPQCGACFYCRRGQPQLCETGLPTKENAEERMRLDGRSLRQLAGLGTFSSTILVDQHSVVPILGSVPLASAALIGCAVLTGIGAVLNTARVQPGESVAVLGCGGVGLNVIQGARLAQASRIIAIDRQPEKLALASRLGATDTILATEGAELVEPARALTGRRGPDVTFEVVGSPYLARELLEITRPGGRMCLVGAPGVESMLSIPVYRPFISQEKTILGCKCGSSHIVRDVQRIVELYGRGDLCLDELVGSTIRIDELGDAMSQLDSSVVARTVVSYL